MKRIVGMQVSAFPELSPDKPIKIAEQKELYVFSEIKKRLTKQTEYDFCKEAQTAKKMSNQYSQLIWNCDSKEIYEIYNTVFKTYTQGDYTIDAFLKALKRVPNMKLPPNWRHPENEIKF